MSVRAYKIIEIKTEKNPTFNLWHSYEWLDGIATSRTFNDDGECQTMYFEKEDIENAIKSEGRTAEQVLVLKEILKDFKDETSVEYYCY